METIDEALHDILWRFVRFRTFLISTNAYSIDAQEVRNPVDPFLNARVPQKAMEWPTDGQNLYNNDSVGHMDVCIFCPTLRSNRIAHISWTGASKVEKTFTNMGTWAPTSR